MADKQVLTQKELEAHLIEQLFFLETSANSFDTGFEGEAKRLAVTLRVLLHDTQHSKSLLGQLRRNFKPFLDTAFPYDPNSLMTHVGLVFIALGPPKTRYVAMLDDVPMKQSLPFDQWWNDIVFVDKEDRTLSRRQLVLTASNQDGGAHVDSSLNTVYAELSKKNSLNWTAVDKGKERPMDDPVRAAIRQIAHETLKTLKTDYNKTPQHEAGIITGGATLVEGSQPSKINRPRPNSSVQKIPKVGRNKPCPCGSGKKYKRCHGK